MAGFIEWLQNHGVDRIFEDPKVTGFDENGKPYNTKRNHNRRAIYRFENEESSKKFLEYVKKEFGIELESFKNNEGQIRAVRVTKELQKQLKAKYLEENRPLESKEHLAKKLAAVQKAKADLLKFNKISDPALLSEQYGSKAFDKVGMMAKLLRNKEDKGWYKEFAKPAGEMALSVYYALNYDVLSEQEREKASSAMKEFAQFNIVLQDKYLNEFHNKNRDVMIFHSGGMSGHSAYRVIRREIDAAGKERYYYTKADGGAGLDRIDGVAFGICTTEITPQYRKNFFGYYVELSEDEKRGAENNPEQYAKYMKATMDYLIECEIKIQQYTSPKIAIHHGEKQDPKDASEWNRLNDIIKKARGEFVLERSNATSYQLTGNCTVYSFMLLIGDFIGINLAYDMMQEVKGYNHHNTLWQLNEAEREIEKKLIAYEIKEKVLKKEKIKGQDPLAYAIIMELKIDGKDPVEWAKEYNENRENKDRIEINGRPPEVWAQDYYNKGLVRKIKRGEDIEGVGDPLKYAIDHNIQLLNMHPLIWALEHNINNEKQLKIEGQDPLIWGIKHNSSIKIEGMSFVRYLQVYGVENFSKLAGLKDNKEVMQALMGALVEEYDALLKRSPINETEIKHLEQFYNSIYAKVNFADREDQIKNRTNPVTALTNILKKYSSTELAAIIKDEKEIADKSNVIPEDILQKLPLKEAHKLWKVGNKIADTGVVQTVVEAIMLAIIRIADVFREESKEESIKKATQFQDLVAKSRERSDHSQNR